MVFRLFLCVVCCVACCPYFPAGEDGPAVAAWDQGRVADQVPRILPWAERTTVVNRLLTDRLENILPELMRQTGIDMWVIINREYNEDPVYLTLVPEPTFAARRTTMLILFDRGKAEGVERLTVSRYPIRDYYEAQWKGGTQDSQWERLAEVIAERNPKRIGINESRTWPVADGLTASLKQRLVEVLPENLQGRLSSAEDLVVRWIETRSQAELEIYPQIVGIARAVISEAFSNRVVSPGITTTEEVEAYIRQRYSDLGLPIWFHPHVNLQRKGVTYADDHAFFGTNGTIFRGDILHCDVGITYLRLNTDTQEMGYVLRTGEKDVPEGLKKALAVGNRWQDLFIDQFRRGRTGNEILAATRARSTEEGIFCSVYTHPLGHFGHAPGPTIGMWDNQGPTPDRGSWELHDNTVYAIEGNVKVKVSEWENQLVQIKMEQDAVFDGEKVFFLGGRQTRWHLVE